jgi:hypothetical protein
MVDLRKEARGRECQIRLRGVCNFNPETTVLAHYRMAGTCGMGMKPNDTQAAWACSSCHDVVDGRVSSLEFGLTQEDIEIDFLQGILRTQSILIKEGKIKA